VEPVIVAAIITALATFTVAYLTFRGKLEEIRTEAQKAVAEAKAESQKTVVEAQTVAATKRASERDDDRDDVNALWAENRRLRSDLDEVRKRVVKLEGEVEHYRSVIQLSEDQERALIKANCKVWRTLPCPRLVQLHDPDVTPAPAREIAGRE
jgi:predicted RNase H-like nuclease (RuvC/YqgF family)